MANITVPSRHQLTVEQTIRDWVERQPPEQSIDAATQIVMTDGRYKFFDVPDDVLPRLRENGVPFAVDTR